MDKILGRNSALLLKIAVLVFVVSMIVIRYMEVDSSDLVREKFIPAVHKMEAESCPSSSYVPFVSETYMQSEEAIKCSNYIAVREDKYSLFKADAEFIFEDYEDGAVIRSGKYAGYQSIIGRRRGGGKDSELEYYTFLTKGNERFIVISDKQNVVPSPHVFNTQKVILVDTLK